MWQSYARVHPYGRTLTFQIFKSNISGTSPTIYRRFSQFSPHFVPFFWIRIFLSRIRMAPQHKLPVKKAESSSDDDSSDDEQTTKKAPVKVPGWLGFFLWISASLRSFRWTSFLMPHFCIFAILAKTSAPAKPAALPKKKPETSSSSGSDSDADDKPKSAKQAPGLPDGFNCHFEILWSSLRSVLSIFLHRIIGKAAAVVKPVSSSNTSPAAVKSTTASPVAKKLPVKKDESSSGSSDPEDEKVPVAKPTPGMLRFLCERNFCLKCSYFTDRLIDWLINQSICWSFGWSIDWLIDMAWFSSEIGLCCETRHAWPISRGKIHHGISVKANAGEESRQFFRGQRVWGGQTQGCRFVTLWGFSSQRNCKHHSMLNGLKISGLWTCFSFFSSVKTPAPTKPAAASKKKAETSSDSESEDEKPTAAKQIPGISFCCFFSK